jgi:hypothetical protein
MNWCQLSNSYLTIQSRMPRSSIKSPVCRVAPWQLLSTFIPEIQAGNHILTGFVFIRVQNLKVSASFSLASRGAITSLVEA